MKNIIVSNVTYQMLAKAAIYPFKGNARQTPSGMWIVPIEDETFELLKDHLVAGETLDDTIQLLFMEAAGAAKN